MSRNFYPRSPCGERLLSLRSTDCLAYFYPRSPCGERRESPCTFAAAQQISIHALLAESDAPMIINERWRKYFYPRSPCGERLCRKCCLCQNQHFYPRSPCGERRSLYQIVPEGAIISIHALLAESDVQYGEYIAINTAFLSTLSLRRATVGRGCFTVQPCYFYPRSPCGERRPPCKGWALMGNISIHALLAESDWR